MKSIFEERAERARLWEVHPARVYLDDIPKEVATRAFEGTSHEPDIRGEDARRGYALNVHRVKLLLDNQPKTPEQIEAAPAILEDFRRRLLALTLAYLHSHARCFSTLIAGGSNFPVRQQEKRHAAADKHMERLLDFTRRATTVVLEKLDRAATPEDRAAQAHAEEANRLKRQVVECADAILALKSGARGPDPSVYRSSLQGVLERAYAKDGAAVREALAEARRLQAETGVIIFAPRNRVWKLAEAPAQEAAQAEVREYEINGVTVEEDPADNRLRLHFDGKPDEALRTALKSRGFKWSPRNQAWQRQLTDNARRAARQILDGKEQAA